jgi:biopolymer transport protein ExbD
MTRFLVILVILVFSQCNYFGEFELPKSDYSEKIINKGIERGLILTVEGYDIYCEDQKIDDLSCVYLNLCDCGTFQDGSNSIVIGLQIDKDTPYDQVDTVLRRLARNNLFSIILLTNQLGDSVGLKIINPWMTKTVSTSVDIESEIDNRNILKFNSSLLFNDSLMIQRKDWSLFWNRIIKNNEPFLLQPNQNNVYSDFILVLDSYYSSYHDIVDSISLSRFNKPYLNLEWEDLSEIDREIKKAITIKPIVE